MLVSQDGEAVPAPPKATIAGISRLGLVEITFTNEMSWPKEVISMTQDGIMLDFGEELAGSGRLLAA